MKTAALSMYLVVVSALCAQAQTPQFRFWVDNIFPDGGSFISEAILSFDASEIFSLCTENPDKLSLVAINANGERMRKSSPSPSGEWIVQIWSGIDISPGKKFLVEIASYATCDQDWNIDIFDPYGKKIVKRTLYGDDLYAFELKAIPVKMDQWQALGYKAVVTMFPPTTTIPEPASFIILLSGSLSLAFRRVRKK